jgi:hypothetical protein
VPQTDRYGNDAHVLATHRLEHVKSTIEIANSATALFLAPLRSHHQDSKRDVDREHRVISRPLISATHVRQNRPYQTLDSKVPPINLLLHPLQSKSNERYGE